MSRACLCGRATEMDRVSSMSVCEVAAHAQSALLEGEVKAEVIAQAQ